MSSTYERELKGLLSGEDDWLRRATRTCDPEAAKNYRKIQGRPFLVVRAAGSLGVDLVALRGDVSFPIEVKSASGEVIHFSAGSGKNHAQAERMREECGRAGIIPLYAYRLKATRGDAWRVFTLPAEGLWPRVALLYSWLPKIATSEGGNYVLRWGEGYPLNRFIDRLSP